MDAVTIRLCPTHDDPPQQPEQQGTCTVEPIFFNAPLYPSVDATTRWVWVVALLDALQCTPDNNNGIPASALRAARTIERSVYRRGLEDYNHMLQLCTQYIRRREQQRGLGNTRVDAYADYLSAASMDEIQTFLSDQTTHDERMYAQWKTEREILHRDITYETLMGDDASALTRAPMTTCGQCGSSQVTSETRQMRAADEGATSIFRCSRCGHTWRAGA